MEDNSKRIAKNTMLLYIRMAFLMIVSIFTSRVILSALGVEDYGIYNIVGGVVAMLAIINGSISSAISRYLTFELGTGNKKKLHEVFCASVTILIFIAIIVVIIAETVGLWFLNNKIVIPEDRLYAANWVYQFSLLTFIINIISVPYNASIISHEKMSVFAFVGIFEGVGKLIIAYLVYISPIDSLIFYSAMVTMLYVGIRIFYGWYCKSRFEECTFKMIRNKSITKEIFSFAGWSFVGASSDILREQGGSIIINLFLGPTINAARGIATQVNGAVIGFIGNFMTAVKPQITKSYAAGNTDYFMKLIFQGARLSYYIILFISLPIIISTPYILNLWLVEVPEHTVSFVRLVLVFTLSESLSNTLIYAMLATGRIRNYQIIVGSLALLNLPLSYLCLKLGMPAESIYLVAILVSVICEAARLIMLRGMIKLSVRAFLKKVYLNVVFVTIIAAIFPVLLSYFVEENFLGFVLLSLTCVLSTALAILYVGCKTEERVIVYNWIRNKVKK